VYLDIEPTLGLARKHGEAEAIRTGLETLEFHRRVRKGYLAQATGSPPGAWLTLDAAHSPAEIEADAWAWIEPLVGSK
jgi:thymidylate kinase